PVEAIRLTALGIDDVLARRRSAAAAPSPSTATATAGRASVDARGAGCISAGRATRELHAWAGVRPDAHGLPRGQIVARSASVLRLGEEAVRVVDVHAGVETVAAADAEPIHVRDAAAPAFRARSTPAVVVLQTGVDVVRTLIVGRHDV